LERFLPAAALVAVLAYNILCSLEVGQRFLSDPRMDAQLFAKKYFWQGAVIENSNAPDWSRPSRIKGQDLSTSFGSRARLELHETLWIKQSDPGGIEKPRNHRLPEDTFTQEGLKKTESRFRGFQQSGLSVHR